MKTLLFILLFPFTLLGQNISETITYSGQQWILDRSVKPKDNVIAVYKKSPSITIESGAVYGTGTFILIDNNKDLIIQSYWRKSLPDNHKWQYYYKSQTQSGKILHYLKYFNDTTIYQVSSKPKEKYNSHFSKGEEDEVIHLFEDQVLGRKFYAIYASNKIDAF